MKRSISIAILSIAICTDISFAQSQRVVNEWAQLSSEEKLCYNLSIRKNNTNIDQLIQNNISPNDQRLANVKQQCDAFLNQNFRKNYQCDFSINGSMVKTLCDEDYAIQGPRGIQRLTVEQALNLLAQGKQISRGYFETAEAIQARQNGNTSVNAETIAKNRAAEEERQKLAQQKAAEEQAARAKEAEKLAQQRREDETRRLEIARAEAQKAQAEAAAAKAKADAELAKAEAEKAKIMAEEEARRNSLSGKISAWFDFSSQKGDDKNIKNNADNKVNKESAEIKKIENKAEKLLGDENKVYFHKCSGNYREGDEYIKKTIHCLTQNEEEFVCTSANKATNMAIRTSSGSDFSNMDRVLKLIDDGNYEFSRKWDGNKCAMIVNVNGIINGNSFRHSGSGVVSQYQYYKGEFIITLGGRD